MYIKLIKDFNIAKGEAEALTLCYEKKGLLLTDDKKRRSMGRKAQDMINRKWSWEKRSSSLLLRIK